jgi:hypothetical protein
MYHSCMFVSLPPVSLPPRSLCTLVPGSRNVIYPWLLDIGWLGAGGSIVSALGDGVMALVVGNGTVLCLTGAPSPSGQGPTLDAQGFSYVGPSFVGNTSIEVDVGAGVRVPCPIHQTGSHLPDGPGPDQLCCSAPTLEALCNAVANVTDSAWSVCMSRGESP